MDDRRPGTTGAPGDSQELRATVARLEQQVEQFAATELALRESEEKYRALLDGASDAIFLADIEGNLLEANRSAEELLGYGRQELLGLKYQQLHPVSEWLRINRAFTEIVEHGTGRIFGTQVLTSGGELIPVDINGSVVEFAGKQLVQGIFHDISDTQRARQALREQEYFTAGVLESIKDGISILDVDRNIVRVNQSMEHWYAHAMPLIGQRCYSAYHGRDEPCEVCPVARTLETGEPAFEIVPRTGLGGMVTGWQALHSFPHYDPVTGLLRGVIEYVRDISEQKRAEEALRENAQQLKDFLSIAAHELRHPIAIIRGYTQYLLESGVLQDHRDCTEALSALVITSDRLVRLAEELLEVSRIEHGFFPIRLEEIELKTCVQLALDELQARGVLREFTLDIDEGVGKVMVDPDKVARLLVILLENAEKFSPSSTPVEIGYAREGETVTISVADRGIGVPEEERDIIFERFYQVGETTHHSVPGVGLGLFIAREITASHGGRIWYEPREDGGSVFRFSLPAKGLPGSAPGF
jgi:PAS domain S-box-containing protein